MIAQIWFARGDPCPLLHVRKHIASSFHGFISTCYLQPKLQPVPLSQQARFWPHQVGPVATFDRNAGWEPLAPLEHTSWQNYINFCSILVSRKVVTLRLLTEKTIFKQSFRFSGLLGSPFQPHNLEIVAMNMNVQFVATSLFQSPCVFTCLRIMSYKSSHPPLQPLCTHAPGQWAPKELPPGKQILVAHLLPPGQHSANCMAFPAAWPMICSSNTRWTSGECNNETTMKLLATAQGFRKVAKK